MAYNGSTKTFDTIADLKTQIGSSNSRVNVLGYYLSGDGGGGEFYWDNTSTDSDNSGTVLQVTGVTTGRWKRAISGNELNVLWFGAKCDYTSTITTDNVTAINAAINAAVVLRNAGLDSQTQPSVVSIYFPYGKGYRITNTITVPNNISVIMDGQVVFDNTANDRAAIVIGDSTLTQRKHHIIDVVNKNATNWPAEDVNGDFNKSSIGIKFINQYYCDIQIRRSSNFTIGAQCFGNTLGFVYNEVSLGVLTGNKVQLELSGSNSGWCNENNFYGGRFTTASNANNNGKNRYGIRITDDDGTYSNHNNNNFYKPCFELGGSIASPGFAMPVLIEYGTNNAFFNCRNEGNLVASEVLMRTLNGSSQNVLEIGAGQDGEVEDLGDNPSSIFYRRGRLLQDKNYLLCYDSSDLLRKVCPFDATNTYVSDELFFLNSTDTSTNNFITSITINADSVQLPTTRGIGIRLDTTSSKRFLLKKSTISGNPGRPCVRCFDSAGNILYSTTTLYVKGYPSFTPNAVSSFGGHYSLGSDSINPFYFAVDSTVAYIDVFFKGGTAPIKLRQFQIQAIDAPAGVISLKKKDGLFANQSPATGTWAAGDVIYNYTPTVNDILLWQCVTAGTPGVWVPVYNSTSGNYIQNQQATAQTANAWVSGTYWSSGLNAFRVINNSGFFSGYESTNTTRTGYLQFNSTSASILGTDIAQPIRIVTAGAVRLTVDEAGKVGIGTGTSDPIYGFRLQGANIGLATLTVQSAAALGSSSGGRFLASATGLPTATDQKLGTLILGTSITSASYGGGVSIDGYSENPWTVSSFPSSLRFNTVPSGTTTLIERMRITSTGDIGIGTSVPLDKLHVVGGARIGNTNSQIRTGELDATTSFVQAINPSSTIGRDLAFFSTAERMRITNAGNVGIGTSSPDAKLEVAGVIYTTATSAEGLRVINDGGFISCYNTANATRTGYLQFNTIGGAILSVELNQPMSLRTNNLERIFIEAGGDVGIGTHDPGAKLEVAGQVKITGGSPGSGKVLTSDSAGLATWVTPVAINTYNVVIPPISANYTVLATDYFIVLKPTTAASRQLILADPATVTGRTLIIMYDAGSSPGTSFQWAFSRNIYDAVGGFRSAFNPSIGGVLHIFSDGTNWRLIGEN